MTKRIKTKKTPKTLETWLAEYAQDHQNEINQKWHRICVPAIVFSILGMLWPVPVGPVNVAFLLAVIVLPFYISLGLGAVAIIVPQLLVCFGILFVLASFFSAQTLFLLSLGIFILAWVGQFVGHKWEGKKPSFLKDLPFLLIGPLWVFKTKLK